MANTKEYFVYRQMVNQAVIAILCFRADYFYGYKVVDYKLVSHGNI